MTDHVDRRTHINIMTQVTAIMNGHRTRTKSRQRTMVPETEMATIKAPVAQATIAEKN
jgi:hypothetical protein